MNQQQYGGQGQGQPNQPNQGGTQAQQPPQPAPYDAPPGTPPPASQPPGMGFQPTGMEAPEGGNKSWILIVVFLVILILGGLVFASWQGWIGLGGIEKLWKKSPTTTTTPSTTTTTTPTTTTATNANDVQRKADLASLKDALKKYFAANQAYPIAATEQKTSDPSTALTVLVPTYIVKLPTDSLTTQYYGYKSDGKTFEISAVLEDATDPSAIKVGNLYVYKVTDSSTETTTSATDTTTTEKDTTTTTPTGTTSTDTTKTTTDTTTP